MIYSSEYFINNRHYSVANLFWHDPALKSFYFTMALTTVHRKIKPSLIFNKRSIIEYLQPSLTLQKVINIMFETLNHFSLRKSQSKILFILPLLLKAVHFSDEKTIYHKTIRERNVPRTKGKKEKIRFAVECWLHFFARQICTEIVSVILLCKLWWYYPTFDVFFRKSTDF